MRTVEDNYALQFNQRINSFGHGRFRDNFYKIRPVLFLIDDTRSFSKISAESSFAESPYYENILQKYNYDLEDNFDGYNTTTDDPSSVYRNDNYNFFFSDKTSDYSFFMNGVFETDFTTDIDNQKNSSYIRAGMILGGKIDNFNYYFFATNGKSFGDKNVYSGDSRFRGNYKYNESAESSFFDETHGFLSYTNKNLEIKIGRDYVRLGHSANFPLLDNSGLPLDMLSVQVQTEFFTYSHLHAKLLDRIVVTQDSISGPVNYSEDKHLAYHRFSINLFNSLILGFGEFVIYSGRGLDISYLNPFSFYKSIEHNNRDRDNSILFMDFIFNSGRGFQPYGLVLLDDIDFSKMGTGWWGNQVIYNAGFWLHTYAGNYPFDINADWMRVEPYVFSHRIRRNNYAENGAGLASRIIPNSYNYAVSGRLFISPRLNIALSYLYFSHGTNIYDLNGNLVFNAGGNINEGKRVSDPDVIHFGEGEIEHSHNIRFELMWEFIRNFRLTFGIDYNEKKSKNLITQELFNHIRIMIKF
ncbi:MAG: hypothetical protein HUU54_05190 [Ignavibacteriaceae bacterium]|nr:hypothetical protein [Ignavibacteriaceae bacterium]